MVVYQVNIDTRMRSAEHTKVRRCHSKQPDPDAGYRHPLQAFSDSGRFPRLPARTTGKEEAPLDETFDERADRFGSTFERLTTPTKAFGFRINGHAQG